jgi:hypothetical protein
VQIKFYNFVSLKVQAYISYKKINLSIKCLAK